MIMGIMASALLRFHCPHHRSHSIAGTCNKSLHNRSHQIEKRFKENNSSSTAYFFYLLPLIFL